MRWCSVPAWEKKFHNAIAKFMATSPMIKSYWTIPKRDSYLLIPALSNIFIIFFYAYHWKRLAWIVERKPSVKHHTNVLVKVLDIMGALKFLPFIILEYLKIPIHMELLLMVTPLPWAGGWFLCAPNPPFLLIISMQHQLWRSTDSTKHCTKWKKLYSVEYFGHREHWNDSLVVFNMLHTAVGERHCCCFQQLVKKLLKQDLTYLKTCDALNIAVECGSS